MARPALGPPKRTVNLRVDAEAYEAIRRYAEVNGRSISWVINASLVQLAEKISKK